MPVDPATIPNVTIPRYDAPRVVATNVTRVISPDPLPGRWSMGDPGHYQRVLLNTKTGELSFYESPQHREQWDPSWKAINAVPRETWNRWYPGTMFSYHGMEQWFQPVAELVSWTIESGNNVPGLPYLGADTANALLAELIPYAQELLDGLYETADSLEWSAAAARAGRQIDRLCSRHRQAADDESADADLADYGQILARFPEAYQPGILGLDLEKLAFECECITRHLGSRHPHIKKVFGAPYPDGSGVGLEVLGVRAWYRTALATGDPRPLVEFAAWEAEHHRLAAGEITAAMTDRELDSWVEREQTRAGQAGMRLLGARDAAYGHRAQLRDRAWDRLGVVGAHAARLENELAQVRAERTALVHQAIAWGRGDADIAARAHMTRQAVHKIRSPKTDSAEVEG